MKIKPILLALLASTNFYATAMEIPMLQFELDEELEIAIYNDDQKYVNRLLARGANANALDDDESPLLIAASKWGNTSIIAALLKHKANINAQNEQTGDFALFQAALAHNKEIVDFLIRNKAEVNMTTKDGSTALMGAVMDDESKRGSYGTLATLLYYGANPFAQASEYNNVFALRQAADIGNRAAIEGLFSVLSQNDEKRIKDSYAVIYALKQRSKKEMWASKDIRQLIAQELIRTIIDERMLRAEQMLSLVDRENNTAHAIAVRENHPAIAKLLDPNNQKSRKKIRTMIMAYIRRILG